MSRLLQPACVPALQQMLIHERRHLQTFKSLLDARGIRHCHALSLWAAGGLLLGALTALIGERAIWVCTSAIENTVNAHLEQQIQALGGNDAEALAAVESIRRDELAHEAHAEQHGGNSGGLYRVLHGLVRSATSFAIWMSTKL